MVFDDIAGVKRMEDRVGAAVEVERVDAELPAQLDVERGSRLYPPAIQPELRVSVIVEHVGAHELQESRRRQMVAHVGKAEPRRDAGGTRSGDQDARLGHAPSAALRENGARPQSLDGDVDGVRVISETISYGVKELHGTGDGVGRGATGFSCEGANTGVRRIEARGGDEATIVHARIIARPREGFEAYTSSLMLAFSRARRATINLVEGTTRWGRHLTAAPRHRAVDKTRCARLWSAIIFPMRNIRAMRGAVHKQQPLGPCLSDAGVTATALRG